MSELSLSESLPLQADPLPIHRDAGGAYRIGNGRVTLEVLLTAYRQGASPDEIVRHFDGLRPADVYTVIGHYLRHREAFDLHLAMRELAYQEQRARDMADGQRELIERMRQRPKAAEATEPAAG